jgi:Common central domain of tyrosinase/Polyphenol oxidase middle domain
MLRRISLIVALALLTNTTRAAEPQVVAQISSVEIFFQTSNPPNMVVTASGLVPTAGFTDVRLIRAIYVMPPLDGVQDYFLVATPPTSPAATVISTVTASDTYAEVTVAAPWLKGVRIHGIGEGVKTQFFANQLRVRKNILDLTAAELAAFEHGVSVMKSRPASDPTSWRFQANIHGENLPASNPLWNQCQHGTNHFLTWHRAFIYQFENILRQASGDDSFNLPYWDWSTSPSLPAAFRVSTSSLFDSTRSINAGQMLSSSVVVDDLLASTSQLNFFSFSNMLEGSPHGAVHVLIGGRMGSVPTAANDPIFWLHHCNIDRVWDSWLAMGGGRADPTDATYLDRQFPLVDRTGAVVNMRVGDFIKSSQLGYRYAGLSGVTESLEITPPSVGSDGMMETVSDATPKIIASSKAGDALEVADAPQALGLEAKRVNLAVREDSSDVLETAVTTASPAAKGRLLIDIHGLAAKTAPRFTYSVYINLPEGETRPEVKRLYRVSTVNLFGVAANEHEGHEGHDAHSEHGDHETDHADGHHASTVQTFDATDTVARLREANIWKADSITVTLEPETPISTMLEDATLAGLLETSSAESQITFDRIDLRSSR